MSELKKQEMEVENNVVNAAQMRAMSDEEYLQQMIAQSWTEEDQAAQEAAEAATSFTKIERIRPNAKNPISVRILPTRQDIDKGHKHAYGFKLNQIFLKLQIPNGKGGYLEGKDGKKLTQFVPVVNMKHVFPELKQDIINTYRIMALKELKSRGVDEKITKIIDGNAFGGGLKFDAKCIAYAITAEDWNKKNYNIQMLELSWGQYKDFEVQKTLVWDNIKKYNLEDGITDKVFDPAVSPLDGRFVEIIGKEENTKIKYVFNISDNDRAKKPFTVELMKAFRDMPSIPSEIYRYTRYHFGATLEFLKQYDAMYSIGVFESPEFQAAIADAESFIPAEDTSAFEFKADIKGGKESAQEDAPMTINDLEIAYQDFLDTGVDEKSEAGAEMKAKMKMFIDQEGLSVRSLRSDTLDMLWDKICNAVDGIEPSAKEEEVEEKRPSTASRAATYTKDEEEEEEDPSDFESENDDDEPETVNQPAPTTASRRAPRRPGMGK